MSTLQQTNPSSQRLITIDILRGFALFGILFVHILYWHTAGPLPEHVFDKISDRASEISSYISNNFFFGKFFAIFSFLFGIGFYLQMKSTQREGANFIRRYSWRLFLLFAIGFVHTIFWIGDILTGYALRGYILLAMRKLKDRTVLILGFILASNILSKVFIAAAHFLSGPENGNAASEGLAESYYQMVRNGSWFDMFSFNFNMIDDKYNYLFFSGRFFMTLGYFLLGMYVARKGWFIDVLKNIKIFKQTFAASVIVAIITVLAIFALELVERYIAPGITDNSSFMFVFSFNYEIQTMAMVFAYISGIILLFRTKFWQKKLTILAPLGRMALTNYLLQTVLGLVLFYNIGFGLFTETSPFVNIIIGSLFFLIQIIFSRWWLTQFNYGPVEWLWRSGTLLRWQKLKKIQAPNKR